MGGGSGPGRCGWQIVSTESVAKDAVEQLREMADRIERSPGLLLSYHVHLDPYSPNLRKQTIQVSVAAAQQKAPADG